MPKHGRARERERGRARQLEIQKKPQNINKVKKCI